MNELRPCQRLTLFLNQLESSHSNGWCGNIQQNIEYLKMYKILSRRRLIELSINITSNKYRKPITFLYPRSRVQNIGTVRQNASTPNRNGIQLI